MSDGNDPDSYHDNAIAYFFIGLVLLGVLWLIWYFNDAEIRNAIRWIRYSEMWLIQWLVPDGQTITFKGQVFNWHESFNTTGQWEKLS